MVLTKQCTKCSNVKFLSEFDKDKYAKDGYKYWCKQCCKKYRKQHYIRKTPKNPICPDDSKYCPKCKQIKPLSEFHKDKFKKSGYTSHCKKCRRKYQEKHKYYFEKYREEHKQYFKEYGKNYTKQRRKEDINFRIAYNLRARVSKAIRSNQKSGYTLELLNCSIAYLKEYLEKLFKKGMSWENYGAEWHIDHIKPISSFDLSKPEEQKKCFYYSNLQPLWAKENLRKGSKYGSCKTELI